MDESGVRTVAGACNLCEAICGLEIEIAGDQVRAIRGAPADPLSRGHLCPKAYALADVHADPDRLRRPVRRTATGWQEISWDDAYEEVARGLATARRQHGADAVAVYLGNPNVHSLGALTHGLPFARMLGTRNRFSATSVDQLPHQLVAHLMYGHQLLLPVPDLDRTQYFLVFGANPVVSNGSLMTVPDIRRRLTDLRRRQGRLVLFDPRRTETAKVADEHHFIRPGADAAVLLALLHVVFAEGLATPASYVDGMAAVRAAVAPFTPERAAAASGVPEATIRRVAREFATASAAVCYGRTGVSTQRFGAVCQWAVQLLNIVTGNLDRAGGSLLTHPAVDLIRSGVTGPGHHGRWHSRVRGLPEFAGELPVAVLAEEIRTPGPGQVKALLTVAGNPVLSSPGGDRLGAALDGLDFMVAVDFYVNETTRHANVILPPTDALERDQYDMVFHLLAVRNTARYVAPVLPKPADARHDWEIFRGLARHYRRHVPARSWRRRITEAVTMRFTPARVTDLALRTGPYRLSLRKLRRHPYGLDLGPLRPSLPKRLWTADKRVHGAPDLLVTAAKGAEELLTGPPDTRDGDLLLIGRRHLRSNNSWLHNSPRMVKGRPRHRLLMHPDDLAARGLADGDRVRVRSRNGEVAVDVQASDDIMPGVVSLPHGFGHQRPGVRLAVATTVDGPSANDLTAPTFVDDTAGTAALNGVPVVVERYPD